MKYKCDEGLVGDIDLLAELLEEDLQEYPDDQPETLSHYLLFAYALGAENEIWWKHMEEDAAYMEDIWDE